MNSMSEEKPCRHEYVKIFQRKLKDLDRRMVVKKAYLPVGFKMGDFTHLGENSFCFCSKCRVRLYPRRSQAEKAANRLALAQGKLNADLEALAESSDILLEGSDNDDLAVVANIHVDELELEAVDAQDIVAEGVKLADDDQSCKIADDEDI
jgi:hypothetical protein